MSDCSSSPVSEEETAVVVDAIEAEVVFLPITLGGGAAFPRSPEKPEAVCSTLLRRAQPRPPMPPLPPLPPLQMDEYDEEDIFWVMSEDEPEDVICISDESIFH